jgi:hypothetical protein
VRLQRMGEAARGFATGAPESDDAAA